MTQSSSPWIKSTCAYCGVGCGIEAKVDYQGRLEVRGDNEHPANYGRLCSKGLALGDTVDSEGRLLHPMIDGEQVPWEKALTQVADAFTRTIAEHGPDAVAFYVSGQLLSEDYYVANKLMKGFIGSANIDTNSRLCMASTVAGHKRAFGTDSVPGCYSDIELSDMVVITGANMAWCHPVLFQRLKAAKQQRPQMKVVVIDPRATDTCSIADLHLNLTPGSDVALFNGLLAYLADASHLNQAYIEEHCEGFDKALQAARFGGSSVQRTSQKTGLNQQQLTTFYSWFGQTEKVLSLFSQGINQSSQGTDKVNSIINCHLATGRIGKTGMGPFSLTGQPNAMGGRETGGMANTLAAHLEFNSDEDHKLLSDFWCTSTLSRLPGRKAVDMFDAIHSGKIKAIWIMATNPAVSMPNANQIKAALKKCPTVVVSDCIADTDTSRLANILLPAQGWSEKSGTVTNSERRISRQRRLLPSPGQARADWRIICDVAKYMGFGEAFSFAHEGEIFNEFTRLSARVNASKCIDLNLTGLSELTEQDYAEMRPQQWPLQTPDTRVSHKRLFADGRFFTPSTKAQFIAVRHMPPASKIGLAYPLLLNTGRIRDQWHTMTRTGLATKLTSHLSEPYLTVNPSDASRFNLSDGGIVNLASRQGQAQLRVDVCDKTPRGQVFMPIHWNQVHASQACVNALVRANTDRLSGQPEFKQTPVCVRPASYKSEALFLSLNKITHPGWPYWVQQKVTHGFLYRLASQLSAPELIAQLTAMMPTSETSATLHFDHPQEQLFRRVCFKDEKLIAGVFVADKLSMRDMDWVASLLSQPLNADVSSSIMTGIAQGALAQGPILCACKQVGIQRIKNVIATQDAQSVEHISQLTGAGGGCGSCVPAIREVLEQQQSNSDNAENIHVKLVD